MTAVYCRNTCFPAIASQVTIADADPRLGAVKIDVLLAQRFGEHGGVYAG